MLRTALALLVLSKAWHGITPGSSTRADIEKRFGKPTRIVHAGDVDVVAYQKENVIAGTVQTQFKVNAKTQVVERIDVFPAPKLTLADISAAYGPACTLDAPETPDRPCYLKSSDAKQQYIHYRGLGLAVFFTPDGKAVQSFSFLPGKK